MAVLATGMGMVSGPASAGVCGQRLAINDGTTLASFCDEAAEFRAQATHTSMTVPANSEAAIAAEQLAKKLGLPGMARSTAVFSVADMAGVAAGAGHPSLPAGLPSEAGLPETSHLAASPDLGGLPSLPNADKLPVLPMLPALPPVSKPLLPEAIGKTSVKAPADTSVPLDAVVGEVKELVPEGSLPLDDVSRVTGTVRVPELSPILDQG
ncbi:MULTISPECIES: hypothetical protein [Nonomuraea]|uniref:Uncharacterized protein n=1 Tax=Nonomuraea mangrovi TaxID=2316207 RepID=A0ABW4T5S3_9ACTN